MPIEGWSRHEPDECAAFFDNLSECPLIAGWSDGKGSFVVLFQDSLVESDGTFPVDLLPHIQAEWLNWQKSKGIAG